MDIALFEPDIPQNTGAIIRTAACLGAGVHIIEPCGFPFSAKGLHRAGMDYVDLARIFRHENFREFDAWRRENKRRLVLLSTKAKTDYLEFKFGPDDILLLGRESAGVPDEVFKAADKALRIQMESGARSLNVGVAGAIVLAEATRQGRKLKGRP